MRGWPGFVILLTFVATACTKDNEKSDGGGNAGCVRTSECSENRVCIAGSCGSPGTIGLNRPCSATRDCTSGLYCSLAQRCVSPTTSGGMNAACLSDDQCAVGLRCEYTGFGGSCVAGGQRDVGDTCDKNLDCISGTYCGAAKECQIFASAFPRFAGATCTDDSGPFKSYFEVPRSGQTLADFYRLPYPNDIRVTQSGGRKNIDLSDFPRPGLTPLGVDLVDLYIDALVEDFDGFAANAPISFRFNQDINFDALNANALDTIRIFDVTGNVGVGSIGYTYTPNVSKYACRFFLSIAPGLGDLPLKANHTYIFLLKRTGLKSVGGETASQPADLTAMLAAAKPGDSGPMDRAYELYAPVRKFIVDQQIAAADVGNVAMFTVGDTTGHMQRLAAAVSPMPAPMLSSLFQCNAGGGTDACDDGSDARRCGADDPNFFEIHGKMRMPLFQMGTVPYEKPGDGGGLSESGGAVTSTGNIDVCFALTLPKGTAPAAGWPLVVYSHGTGGSFRSFISDGVARALASASTKSAVLSFDSVGHGARRGSSTKSPDELVFNVLNPRAARDNFLQGAADILTALKFPASPIPGGWTGPAIKLAGKPLFFGHSQGSTHGELALAFSDEAPATVLSGAGANVALSLLSKTSPFSVPDGLTFLLGEALDSAHPMIVMWSNYFDRADPANYARLIVGAPPSGRHPKHVFMSFSESDTFAPKPTLETNAVFLGIPVATPVLYQGAMNGPVGRPVRLDVDAPGGKVTGGVFEYTASGFDGHFVAWKNPDGLRDVTAFITSFFASGVPSVP